MRELDSGGGARVRRFSDLLRCEPMSHSSSEEELANCSTSSSSGSTTPKGESSRYDSDVQSPTNDPEASSPYFMSHLSNPTSFIKSPWTFASPAYHGLLGSFVRDEGHVYSLAADGDLLYTGSDSKNIRVWKGRKQFSGFKSNSGLVKAIVITDGRIFTGHQDGKIRVWKASPNDPTVHKRVGSLPTMKDFLKSSINPSNYIKVRRHRNAVWLRHVDAVSCLSLDEENGLLYSGSWDKTFKVWRVSDSKCLESVEAHGDAINSIAVGFDGLVFTGSADGTVKAWRREETGRGRTKHVLVETLLSHACAVTAVAVDKEAAVIYSGSSDGVVNFWEWRHGRGPAHGGELQGHRQAVLCLAAAGGLVVSGSADKSICVWKRDGDGAGHCRVAVLSGHAGPVKCLAVEEEPESAGENWVVYSGSLDRSVKVWRVSAAPRVGFAKLVPAFSGASR